MGKLFTKSSDVCNMVREKFGTTDNYLVALKRNSVAKNLLEWWLSGLIYALDNSRTFVLYFDDKGIYEKELSLTDNAPFLLIPWREVYDFNFEDKGNKVYINVNHLGKTYSYEITFNNYLLRGNRERLQQLIAHNFRRTGGNNLD
ncbi:hypothetical protein PYS61_02630 [Amygdalobacter indicium]|uniref:Uncharacterized protein n=1 Tax=Amygdalobacter indicium TaxID=3029272 RepID=A0ABY8C828_9FIRM|nr:hypothetical protein [Amygdalobacter indicium]WEG36079.1 hypothetical protein PYS61_02630 [Amygdalobacter indicium]